MRSRWLIGLSLALLLVFVVAPVAQAAPATAPSEQTCGYWYTVQRGDSWSRLSARTGISIAALQAANPAHIHPNYWLIVGHTLWIPCGGGGGGTCSFHYTVRSGDSWFAISRATGVPLSTLYAANPTKVRPPSYVLYVGEVLCIP